ncbi:hypothetical protein PVAP13_7KG004754 [Panicum virgatum]|uniref:Uncharacterized protein n=1 Tax=Panicum virgatum TaxID=38727 RepID=A0A8T0QIG4_PANVG|nr:hypothetical protein PVAP13_7KG004754 [Panicum virgatum]
MSLLSLSCVCLTRVCLPLRCVSASPPSRRSRTKKKPLVLFPPPPPPPRALRPFPTRRSVPARPSPRFTAPSLLAPLHGSPLRPCSPSPLPRRRRSTSCTSTRSAPPHARSTSPPQRCPRRRRTRARRCDPAAARLPCLPERGRLPPLRPAPGTAARSPRLDLLRIHARGWPGVSLGARALAGVTPPPVPRQDADLPFARRQPRLSCSQRFLATSSDPPPTRAPASSLPPPPRPCRHHHRHRSVGSWSTGPPLMPSSPPHRPPSATMPYRPRQLSNRSKQPIAQVLAASAARSPSLPAPAIPAHLARQSPWQLSPANPPRCRRCLTPSPQLHRVQRPNHLASTSSTN